MRREDKTWSKAVMFGIGHGGLESVLLVGGLMVLTLFSLFAAANGGLAQLPEDPRAAATQQTTSRATQRWNHSISTLNWNGGMIRPWHNGQSGQARPDPVVRTTEPITIRANRAR